MQLLLSNLCLSLADCGERDSSHKNSSYVYQAIKGTTILNQCSGSATTLYMHPTFTNDISQNSASKYIIHLLSCFQLDWASHILAPSITCMWH